MVRRDASNAAVDADPGVVPMDLMPRCIESLLPASLAALATVIASNKGVHAAAVVPPLLSVLSFVVGSGLLVSPSDRHDWLERPIMWCLLVSPPGARKTAVLQLFVLSVRVVQFFVRKLQLRMGLDNPVLLAQFVPEAVRCHGSVCMITHMDIPAQF
jgi:hypothetical protein